MRWNLRLVPARWTAGALRAAGTLGVGVGAAPAQFLIPPWAWTGTRPGPWSPPPPPTPTPAPRRCAPRRWCGCCCTTPCASMRPAPPTSPTWARIAATGCCAWSARAGGRRRSRSPRVHHRGKALQRLAGGQDGPVAAGPLQDCAGQPAGQGSPPRDDGDRFIVCFNPDQAERDAAVRARLIAQLEEAIAGSDALSKTERARIEGTLAGKPGLKRFLRVTPAGLLRVDKAKAKTEANLDGKYLLRSCDPDLSAEDIALGYKQLLEVERGWRYMKQVLDLRPVYHRRGDRIRAHVIVLARPAAHPRDREHRGAAVEQDPRGAAAPARRHLDRPRRHLPAIDRADQAPAGHSIPLSVSNRRRRPSPWPRRRQCPDLRVYQRLVTRPVTGLFMSPQLKACFRLLGGGHSAEPRAHIVPARLIPRGSGEIPHLTTTSNDRQGHRAAASRSRW